MLKDYHGERSRDRDNSQLCYFLIAYDLYKYSLMAFGSISTRIFNAPLFKLVITIFYKCQVLMSASLTIVQTAVFKNDFHLSNLYLIYLLGSLRVLII